MNPSCCLCCHPGCWHPAEELPSKSCLDLFLQSACLMVSAAFTRTKKPQVSQDLFCFDNVDLPETSLTGEALKYFAKVIPMPSYLFLLVSIRNEHETNTTRLCQNPGLGCGEFCKVVLAMSCTRWFGFRAQAGRESKTKPQVPTSPTWLAAL